MKSQLQFARMFVFAALCLALAVVPAAATTYSNGNPNGDTDAWTINSGYVVSDTFTTLSSADKFSIWVWEYPGDTMKSLGWSISTSEFGSPVAGGSGTAVAGVNLVDEFLSVNAYGYNFDKITVTALGVTGLTASSTYWLNLQDAVMSTPTDPVFWDENSGPSMASENSLGTIPSETFTISDASGSGGSTPEPSSLMLFGSGLVGLGGVLRRRFLR